MARGTSAEFCRQQHKLEQRKARLVPWIANPLQYHHLGDDEDSRGRGEDGHGDEGAEKEGYNRRGEMEETSPIELFYDLFFVGNLTTVTGVHYITELKSLASYVLFFIILWFTWFHTTLHDVRFSVDSVYARVCKALDFGVLVGFSSVSTRWNPFDTTGRNTVNALKTMTIALFVSRIILAIQYGVVLVFAWKQKRAIPLAIHTATMLIAAAIYLGIFFAFHPENDDKSYVGWYAVIAFEVVVTVGTSSIWQVVSFGRTHLVERMGLLTLISMGEGIIIMMKAVNSVVRASGWDAAIVGIMVSAMAIIYFCWMFYFDYTPRNVHYGTFKQQLWALLHFPYHLALVLSFEGLRQFTTFYSFATGVSVLVNAGDSAFRENTLRALAFWLRRKIQRIYDEGASSTILKDYSSIMSYIDVLSNVTTADLSNSTQYAEITKGLEELSTEVFVGYSEYLGIHLSKGSLSNSSSTEFDPFKSVYMLYELVFNYFFAALGTVFAMYALFALLVRRDMDRFDVAAVALRALTAIAMWGLLAIYDNSSAYDSFLDSPWIIPTPCIVLFTVLILDKLVNLVACRRVSRELDKA